MRDVSRIQKYRVVPLCMRHLGPPSRLWCKHLFPANRLPRHTAQSEADEPSQQENLREY